MGDVTADGPSEKGGVKRGDIITKFNGTDVESSTQLRNLVAEAAPGSTIKLTVLRDGKEMELSIVLGERPQNLASNTRKNEQSEEQASKKLGFSIQTLTPDIAKQFGYQKDHGVAITEVTPGSPADDAGLKRGDLIKQVNREDVESVEDFNKAVGRHKNGDTIAFLVRRGDNTFFAAVQIQ